MRIAEKSLNMIGQKAVKYGIETLSDDEILALLIGNTNTEDPITLARSILLNNNGIENLYKLTTEDIATYIGDRALVVSSAIELSKRVKKYRYLYDSSFNDPDTVFNYCCSTMAYESQEHFRVLALNTKNYLIGDKTMFIGTHNNALVSPKEVLTYALKKNACSIIVVHNHPSGQCDPSNDDINQTRRLQEGCKSVGIGLLDHIIIGNGEYCTLKGRGIL